MTRRVVIADAGPLIALARIEALGLLVDFFDTEAIALYRNPGLDFHDALIATLATARGAQAVTFDAKASKRLGMRLLA